MTIRLSFFFTLAVLVCFAIPAHAGIDHRCLNQCVASGLRSDKCLSQCSYKELPQPTTIGALNPHRVLEAPLSETVGIPIADELPPKPPAPPPPEKNYACFIPCVNSHTAYTLCEQRCARESIRH